MITQFAIHKALESPTSPFDYPDKCAIKWRYKLYGGFFASLFDSIARADLENRELLSRGFPDQVEGYVRWTEGDLHTRLNEYSDYLLSLETEEEAARERHYGI